MAAAGTPTLQTLRAPADWSAIDFISDLHLSEDTPRTFEAFAAHLRCTPADAVFILGDLFEVWVGDDMRHAGFEARCAAVLAEAAQQRTVAFMAGNRDFLVGPALLEACGVMRLEDPTLLLAYGRRVLLSHGDALCLSDTDYQAFRVQVRDATWQREFLAQPLDQRRRDALAIRAESERRKRAQGASDWIDIDPAAAAHWMRAAQAAVLVHGHTHRPADQTFAPGLTRHVLSDWDLEADAGDRRRAEVLRWRASGFERLPPAGMEATP